jgi:hypothetical protein
MSKPENVPQDIDQVATRIAGEFLAYDVSCNRIYRLVTEALLADRERAATYIERRPGDITNRQFLADAIRIGDAYDEQGNFVPSPARAIRGRSSPSQGVTDAT